MRKHHTNLGNGPNRLNAVIGNDRYRRIISTTAHWIFSNLRRLWNSAGRSLTSPSQPTTGSAWTRRSVRQSTSTRTRVLLATCTALLVVNDFSKPQVKILIDPGSEISLITNKLVTQHRLNQNSFYSYYYRCWRIVYWASIIPSCSYTAISCIGLFFRCYGVCNKSYD